MSVLPELYLYSQQESVEGLILFNMFITNLEKENHYEISQFLNNTKLFRRSETELGYLGCLWLSQNSHQWLDLDGERLHIPKLCTHCCSSQVHWVLSSATVGTGPFGTKIHPLQIQCQQGQWQTDVVCGIPYHLQRFVYVLFTFPSQNSMDI